MEKYFKRQNPPLGGSSHDAQTCDNEQDTQDQSKRACVTMNSATPGQKSWIRHCLYYNNVDHFTKIQKVLNLKYIDPTYMIRAIPSNASDNVYCTLLAHSAIHGAMAGYTGFTVGPVNGRHAYIPFHRITETQNKVVITDRMWARLLSSTNQPSFLSQKDIDDVKKEEEKAQTQLLEGDDKKRHHDEESIRDNSIES